MNIVNNMHLVNTMNSGVNTVYNWLKPGNLDTTIKQLSDNQTLNIANEINDICSKTDLIESTQLKLPKIVVVGSQSSGKSSLLNSIISFDILPTNTNLCTRLPIDIRMHQMKDLIDGYVEFGKHTEEGWITEKKITIKQPLPLESEIKQIRDFIEEKTVEIAGNLSNISATPLIINIYSPNVPNLSLTDLPGLTQIACVDRGQPEDIKERIESLVTSYVIQENTIILAVMASRSDLETDIGLALIKKHDTGQRIIGVLTKPDLMNNETHVGDYLLGNVSKNLMLTYGYYVIKNRSCQETKVCDILKGFEIEKEYFSGHPEYKKPLYKDKIGNGNLVTNLNKILVNSIKELLPSVMTEIVGLESKINGKLDKIGQNILDTKEAKLSYMNKYITNFNYKFIDSVESRGTVLNTGKLIKDSFIVYRKELLEIKPFGNNKVYNQEYFQNIMSSFEGNHMSFHIPPIQILEACMKDSKNTPIMTLHKRSIDCVDKVCVLITNLIRNITLEEEFAQYPYLASHIMSSLIDEVISKVKDRTKQRISELLQNENDYIWTDNLEFINELSLISKTNLSDVSSIIKFLESYFSTVKYVVAHSVPKIIMSSAIREIENSMLTYLIHTFVTEEKLGLLKQDEEVEKQRNYYNDMRNRILLVKKDFNATKTI